MAVPATVRPPDRPPVPILRSGPTRLRVPELLHATDHAADDVLSGRCDRLFPAAGLPTDRRWFTRIHGDDELEVWLVSWGPGHATELHDHGGSLAAMTMLSGTVDEYRWDGTKVRRRRLEAGDQAGFPLGWVHDLVGVSAPAAVRPAQLLAAPPALSVHAYSPPLTAVSYYEVTAANRLRRTRTELTDEP